MQISTVYVEVSKLLSGTNKVSFCLKSLVDYICNKHKLSIHSLPLQQIHQDILTILQSFELAKLVPSIYFKNIKNDIYLFYYEYFKDTFLFSDIANAVVGYSRSNVNDWLNNNFKEGIFTLLLDDLSLEMPHIKMHLLDQPISFKYNIKEELTEFNGQLNEEIFQKIDFYYRNKKNQQNYAILVSENIRKEVLKNSRFMYDGRIHYELVDNQEELNKSFSKLVISSTNQEENNSELFINLRNNLLINCDFSGLKSHFSNQLSNFTELDYRVTHEEKKGKDAQIYSTHLKDLSNSLGISNLFAISKNTEKIKTSGKSKKIIQENLKKIEIQEKEKEDLFINNMFNKYKNSKISIFDLIIPKNYKIALRKSLLLKIEFYYKEWELENRKIKPEEEKKVPIYLNCLEYLQDYKDFPDEINWVSSILIELGFKSTSDELLGIQTSPNDFDISFQLKHCGSHLKRSVDSKPDPRVLFEPDSWQIQLLDLVDKNESVIISAPTSSGKTFICFYAIHKILSECNDIILFILPTKALVNQVCADIYSRFSNVTVKHNLQGQIMTDYSVNPFNSQILLTIPSMAESILLSNFNIKYIILDECHLICQNESVERILLINTKPILMLSASIGNLKEFHHSVQKILDKPIHCLEYKERYCDLKPFVFHQSLVPINTLFAYDYNFIKQYGFTNDLNFLPDEILNLYYSIYYVIKDKSDELIQFIRPQNYFKSNIISKREVICYEWFLLTEFQKWINEGRLSSKEVGRLYRYITNQSVEVFKKLKAIDSNLDSKLDSINSKSTAVSTNLDSKSTAVSTNLDSKSTAGSTNLDSKSTAVSTNLDSKSTAGSTNLDSKSTSDPVESTATSGQFYYTTEDYMLNNIKSLCDTLKASNMLPCIIFNTDRRLINKLSERLFNDLDDINVQDNKNKEKLLKEKKRVRDLIEKGKDLWKQKSIQDEEEFSILTTKYQHTFTDENKLSDYELKGMINQLKKTPLIFKKMLFLGIGVHHDGVNKSYRSAVEILFRKKHLQIIFSTDTLSLGINMPCKTVVFSNSLIYSLLYKQMSGRAGRRGFDLLGNVVFYGIEEKKVKNMLVSDKTILITKNMFNYVDVLYEVEGVYRGRLKDKAMFLGLYNESKLSFTKLSYNELSSNDLSCNDLSCTKSSCTKPSCTEISCKELSCKEPSCTKVSCTKSSCTKLSCTKISSNDLSSNDLSCKELSCKEPSCTKLSWEMKDQFNIWINCRSNVLTYKTSLLTHLGYLHQNKKTYKSDILILNKTKELESMVVLYLIEEDFPATKSDLLELLVHFFGIKPSLNPENILNPLSCNSKVELILSYLHNSLFTDSFKLVQCKKDNYILRYVYNNEKDDIKALFNGLKEIEDFVLSVIQVYERFNLDEERVHRLKVFGQWFGPKRTSINA